MSSPIYIRIHNDLKESIEKGKWQVGDRIPAERELAEKYGVSRMTLRQAVQTLVDEGILERRVGSGTFVARKKVQEKMSGTTSFYATDGKSRKNAFKQNHFVSSDNAIIK